MTRELVLGSYWVEDKMTMRYRVVASDIIWHSIINWINCFIPLWKGSTRAAWRKFHTNRQ